MNLYKSLFSHRKGLISQVNIMQKECMPLEVCNAITSAYYLLCCDLSVNAQKHYYNTSPYTQKEIEQLIWWKFLNKSIETFKSNRGYNYTFSSIINDTDIIWNRKLDLIEFVIRISIQNKEHDRYAINSLHKFVDLLNEEFERLDYGYRIVNYQITDITSEEERSCIEQAIANSNDNVKEHLSKAIELYSQKPEPNIRNSIKESISAVEVICRELTGEDTLGKALNKLEGNGIVLQKQLKDSMDKLYAYTNQPNTGIRHALLDSDSSFVPSKEEAYFMLITCSAFINYLRMKVSNNKSK